MQRISDIADTQHKLMNAIPSGRCGGGLGSAQNPIHARRFSTLALLFRIDDYLILYASVCVKTNYSIACVLQKRRWATNSCLVVTPFLFCVFLYFLQAIVNRRLDTQSSRCGCRCVSCCDWLPIQGKDFSRLRCHCLSDNQHVCCHDLILLSCLIPVQELLNMFGSAIVQQAIINAHPMHLAR